MGDTAEQITPSSETAEPARRFPIFLSIVIIDRNSQPPSRDMIARIVDTVGPLVSDFEIILVDNGAFGETRHAYAALTDPAGLPNVQVFHLLQRVEAEVAFWSGIENSLGDYVLAFDPYEEDLSCLPRAIELALGGKDVVFISNQEPETTGVAERLAARAFRSAFRRLYGIALADDASQHRLISKKVVNFLLQMPRPALSYRALPARAGFASETLRYRARRVPLRGQGFGTRMRRALNLVFSSTQTPLRVASMLALFGSLANVVYSIYVVIVSLARSDIAAGWTTLSLQQSGMFFLISLVLFLVVEYFIRVVQWNMEGSAYYIVHEATSTTLTRRTRLNVEPAQTETP